MRALAFSNTGDTLIAIENSNKLYIWDINKHTVPETFEIYAPGIIELLFTTDGSHILSRPSGLWKLGNKSLENIYRNFNDYGDIFPDGSKYIKTFGNL